MNEKSIVSRRKLLTMGGVSALALGAHRAFASTKLNAICEHTPRQPEGPFYPVSDQEDKNNDLTHVIGKNALALGSIIYLSGVVRDQNCEPVSGVMVEIWQACESGRYNHPGDHDNPSALDPNFQYWGIAITKSDGSYSFKTIVPGHYSAGPNWIRPPHIHFKVHKRGIRELITQMYFAGNPYNDADLILKDIPAHEREKVVRPMLERPSEHGRTTFEMSFDISVQKLF